MHLTFLKLGINVSFNVWFHVIRKIKTPNEFFLFAEEPKMAHFVSCKGKPLRNTFLLLTPGEQVHALGVGKIVEVKTLLCP